MVIDTHKLSKLRRYIAEYAIKSHREPSEITLVGASKTRGAEVIRAFSAAGLNDFGENYLDEALHKIKELADLPIVWHYIGSIQSNKTKAIAENFDWVHTVDRAKIARRLDQHIAELDKSPLNVLIQVNLDSEESKSGVSPLELPELVSSILSFENLRLRGLMSIPKPREAYAEQVAVHQNLVTLKNQLEAEFSIELDTLSAGMSSDMEAAIAAGSTHIRVGTDLFGKREAKV